MENQPCAAKNKENHVLITQNTRDEARKVSRSTYAQSVSTYYRLCRNIAFACTTRMTKRNHTRDPAIVLGKLHARISSVANSISGVLKNLQGKYSSAGTAEAKRPIIPLFYGYLRSKQRHSSFYPGSWKEHWDWNPYVIVLLLSGSRRTPRCESRCCESLTNLFQWNSG